MSETCALDVAERGGAKLGEVGEILGVTRQRVDQIQERAIQALKGKAKKVRHFLER